MPCVRLDTCYLKEVLAALRLPRCNWLISDLDCLDYCGWEGCEKWAEQELLLTDEALRRDVELRDMQIIWGVFSAIPAAYSREEILRCPRPESESPRYMSSHIVPQHPLALLELYADDGSSLLVSARDAALLEPLARLSCRSRDEEAHNRVMNAQLRRIQDALRREVPDVTAEEANEVQWRVWHRLFRERDDAVEEERMCAAVREVYAARRLDGKKSCGAYWDPYGQE